MEKGDGFNGIVRYFAKLLETTGNAIIRNIKIRCHCQSFLYFDLSHCFLDDFLLAEAV